MSPGTFDTSWCRPTPSAVAQTGSLRDSIQFVQLIAKILYCNKYIIWSINKEVITMIWLWRNATVEVGHW